MIIKRPPRGGQSVPMGTVCCPSATRHQSRVRRNSQIHSRDALMALPLIAARVSPTTSIRRTNRSKTTQVLAITGSGKYRHFLDCALATDRAAPSKRQWAGRLRAAIAMGLGMLRHGVLLSGLKIWRTGPSGLPSHACISANARALAQYAALCQEQSLVPIVESIRYAWIWKNSFDRVGPAAAENTAKKQPRLCRCRPHPQLTRALITHKVSWL